MKLTSAANIEVEPIIADIFAKVLNNKDTVNNLISNIGSGAAAAPAGVAPAAAGGAAAPAEEAKVEEAEESDEDMGFGLFD